MKKLDYVYDEDAYIGGIVIKENENDYSVLWGNGVIGKIKDEYDEIKVMCKKNIKAYSIIDILHTGHHGKENESKVGEKYDERRKKIAFIDVNTIVPGFSIYFILINKEDFEKLDKINELEVDTLITTRFENVYEKNGYTYLRTLNSIYKLKYVEI